MMHERIPAVLQSVELAVLVSPFAGRDCQRRVAALTPVQKKSVTRDKNSDWLQIQLLMATCLLRDVGTGTGEQTLFRSCLLLRSALPAN